MAQETARIHLPRPRRDSDEFLKLVAKRRSCRKFSDRPIEPQALADLLWAGFGVRDREGYRTAPSARNWREIDVYVALSSGLYRYDPFAEDLDQVDAADLRAATGQQDYVGSAAANLVYVADYDRMQGAPAKECDFLAAADAGVICENVYLFCASAGLATVVRALIDRPALAGQMKLGSRQRIILAQSVGYAA